MEQKNIQGIEFAMVDSKEEGFELARKILNQTLDQTWALFLSGGTTPKPLYEAIAHDSELSVGAVGMVDERYGEPMHRISNELSLKESGLLEYLSEEYIDFYSMLESNRTREELAERYNEIVRDLFERYEHKFAILGMGEDGHTAGIAPNRSDFTNPLFNPENNELLVGEFSDPVPMSEDGSPVPPNGFGERITLTFKALSQMDKLLVIAFGEKKRKAFDLIFEGGPVEDCPLRFVLDPEVASKTLFITDQKI